MCIIIYTCSDNITTFSTIMSKQFIHLLRCCEFSPFVYILGSVTQLALCYFLSSIIATTIGTALPAIDKMPIASAKKLKSISYIFMDFYSQCPYFNSLFCYCGMNSLYTCSGVEDYRQKFVLIFIPAHLDSFMNWSISSTSSNILSDS